MQPLNFEDIHPKVESLAQEILGKAGVELIELKLSGHKNDVRIQITADKPNGGISIGSCAILNKNLVAAIEKDLLPPEIFSLELSSPGLDRPLVTRKDFLRCVGSELDIWLNGPVDGIDKKHLQGILKEVTETALVLDISIKANLVLPLTSIVKGVLVIK